MSSKNENLSPAYWDEIGEETLAGPPLVAWRAFMRQIYANLISRRELLNLENGLCLKTDLFEEAVSDYHLLPEWGNRPVGIDASPFVVRAARDRLKKSADNSAVTALFLAGDLRRLPFKEESLSAILSGSSLDHFETQAEIKEALNELARVLKRGGVMIITFDNPHNLAVWLRNNLPFKLLLRLKLVSYFVGATLTRAQALRELEAAGFIVRECSAVAHVPRAPAIWLVGICERLGIVRWAKLLTRFFLCFEILERSPLRFVTGYYLAFHVEKR